MCLKSSDLIEVRGIAGLKNKVSPMNFMSPNHLGCYFCVSSSLSVLSTQYLRIIKNFLLTGPMFFPTNFKHCILDFSTKGQIQPIFKHIFQTLGKRTGQGKLCTKKLKSEALVPFCFISSTKQHSNVFKFLWEDFFQLSILCPVKPLIRWERMKNKFSV